MVCGVTLQRNTRFRRVFGSYLAGYDLLQGVLTLGVGVVSHDDHDDRHELVHQSQWAVFQLSGQDALRVHVRDFLDFLRGKKCKQVQNLEVSHEAVMVSTSGRFKVV